MTMIIRQSTSIDVAIGPMLDETDGKTAESALTITQPDVRLKKNGGNWAQKAAAQTLSHEENGWYEVTLDATDTDTVGQLIVAIHESGALPVWREFQVVEEAIYDALFAASATGLLPANVTQWLGSAAATPTAAGVPEVDVTHWLGSAAPANTGDAFARLGAPAGASIAADIADVEGKVDDLESRVGTPSDLGSGATVAANLADIEGQTDDIAAVLADTDEIQQELADGGRLDLLIDAILADTGTDGVVVAAGAKTGYRLSATGVDDVLDEVIEGSYTMRQFLRLFAAALLGKVSGAATNAPVFRDTGDSTNRISATTDADGNRSAVTLDAS